MLSDASISRRLVHRVLAILAATSLALEARSAPVAQPEPQSTDINATAVTPLLQLMTYIAQCALPPDTRTALPVEGRLHEFVGELGYAPEWPLRSLSVIQQRQVSACVLARTNRHGRNVRIELVDARSAPVDRLSTWEGGYFGNLFTSPQSLYACSGSDREDRITWLTSQARECAIESEAAPHQSRCGFVHVGPCNREAFLRDGTDYFESALFVFLEGPGKPDEPSAAEGMQIVPQRSPLGASAQGESTLFLDTFHQGETRP